MTSYNGNLDELLVLRISPQLKTRLAQRAESMQVSLSAAGRLAMSAGLANMDTGGPAGLHAADGPNQAHVTSPN
jgi:hypothetical protein